MGRYYPVLSAVTYILYYFWSNATTSLFCFQKYGGTLIKGLKAITLKNRRRSRTREVKQNLKLVPSEASEWYEGESEKIKKKDTIAIDLLNISFPLGENIC